MQKAPLVSTVFLVLVASSPGALADSTRASCEVHKNHHLDSSASGNCKFSQRQGYVDIKLHNGETYSLRPTDKANHFKDQENKHVSRETHRDGMQQYSWEHKNIKVSFDRSNAGGGNGKASHPAGHTVENLEDLVGARAGQAEGQVRSRGYVFKNSSKSGSAIYGNWKERASGQCVTIRTEDGRYKSIVYSTDFDCEHAQDGGGHHGNPSQQVNVADMARYCAGMASSEYGQRPQNITTVPAFKDGGMFKVYGQYPPSGRNPTLFTCTFDAHRKYSGIHHGNR